VELAADGSRLGLLRIEDVVLHDLLRDRRAAERRSVMGEVVDNRDQKAPIVDAGVGIEGTSSVSMVARWSLLLILLSGTTVRFW